MHYSPLAVLSNFCPRIDRKSPLWAYCPILRMLTSKNDMWKIKQLPENLTELRALGNGKRISYKHEVTLNVTNSANAYEQHPSYLVIFKDIPLQILCLCMDAFFTIYKYMYLILNLMLSHTWNDQVSRKAGYIEKRRHSSIRRCRKVGPMESRRSWWEQNSSVVGGMFRD